MNKHRVLLAIIAIAIALFVPIVVLGVLAVLYGVFWRPMERKLRIVLVVLGSGLILASLLAANILRLLLVRA